MSGFANIQQKILIWTPSDLYFDMGERINPTYSEINVIYLIRFFLH